MIFWIKRRKEYDTFHAFYLAFTICTVVQRFVLRVISFVPSLENLEVLSLGDLYFHYSTLDKVYTMSYELCKLTE